MFAKNIPITLKPPIERLTILNKQDPLSKKIRELDNLNYSSTSYSSLLGVNITTNEIGVESAFQILSASKAAINTCHIGVSGWYNLDVIATRRSQRGIIFDSNPEVALFFDHTFRTIIDSSDRDTFIEKMEKCIKKYDYDNLPESNEDLKYMVVYCANHKYKENLEPEYELKSHAQNSIGWLANKERYKFIRNLVIQDKIAIITRDITDSKAFKRIQNLLQNNNICVDTIYLSNVPDYIYEKENKHAFLETISYLADEKTLLIDAERNSSRCELTQRVIEYRKLNLPEKQFAHWFSESFKDIGNKKLSSGAGTFFDKPSEGRFLATVSQEPEIFINNNQTNSFDPNISESSKTNEIGRDIKCQQILEKKKTGCNNYSVVFIIALLVATSAYFLNQSEDSLEIKPSF